MSSPVLARHPRFGESRPKGRLSDAERLRRALISDVCGEVRYRNFKRFMKALAMVAVAALVVVIAIAGPSQTSVEAAHLAHVLISAP